LTLYSYPNNYRVWKSQVVAAYNEVKLNVPSDFKMGVDNKTPAFLAKFPLGKVPALETSHGPLYESGAIMKYIARLRADTHLFGQTFYENALVEQWIDWCAFEVEPARGAWLLPVWGIFDFNQRVYEEAKKDIGNYLQVLDNYLLHHTFLVGNQITLADIVIATTFVDLWRTVLTNEFTKNYINFTRWFDTLVHQPQFSCVGPVTQAASEKQPEKKAAAATEKHAEPAAKQEKKEKKGGEEMARKNMVRKKVLRKKKARKKEVKRKELKRKEAKKNQRPKNQQQRKKEVKKEADLTHLMEDDEDKPKEKAKNPLDALPKSPMILDAVKKLFFTEKPFNPKFFDTIWNGADEVTKWDNAGYSVYTCDYKYNDEHKVYFLTCNLMGGFIQRVERLRKYGFGAVNLIGETDEKAPWKLGGIWIFRGQDIPAEMTECDDSEHFNFTKLDLTNAAGKKRMQELFVGDTVDGLNVLERRYFK